MWWLRWTSSQLLLIRSVTAEESPDSSYVLIRNTSTTSTTSTWSTCSVGDGGREREHTDNHDPCRSPSQRLYACQSPSLFTDAILFSPAGPIGNHLQYVYGSSEPIAGFQLAPFFTGLSMSRKAQV